MKYLIIALLLFTNCFLQQETCLITIRADGYTYQFVAPEKEVNNTICQANVGNFYDGGLYILHNVTGGVWYENGVNVSLYNDSIEVRFSIEASPEKYNDFINNMPTKIYNKTIIVEVK